MTPARFAAAALFAIASLFGPPAWASPESDFWKWFQRSDAMLFDFESDQVRSFELLSLELHKVHPKLTFEFGPKENNRRDFVISADGNLAAFPKVESLFAASPAMAKWKVIAFRPRRAATSVQYNGLTVNAAKVRFLLRADGKKAGITIMIPGYAKEAHEKYAGIAFLLLDQALGEYDVETRVGFVNVQGMPVVPSEALPFPKLASNFDTFFAKH